MPRFKPQLHTGATGVLASVPTSITTNRVSPTAAGAENSHSCPLLQWPHRMGTQGMSPSWCRHWHRIAARTSLPPPLAGGKAIDPTNLLRRSSGKGSPTRGPPTFYLLVQTAAWVLLGASSLLPTGFAGQGVSHRQGQGRLTLPTKGN